MAILERPVIEESHKWAEEIEAKGYKYPNILIARLAEFAVKTDLVERFPGWPIEVSRMPESNDRWDFPVGGRVFIEIKISKAKCELSRLTGPTRSPIHCYMQARPLATEFEKLKSNKRSLKLWLLRQTEIRFELIGWADSSV